MWLLLVVSCFFASSNGGYLTAGFRPPAVPLIVTNPYNSFWSVNTNLSEGNPQHWSGSNLGSVGMIKIDGIPYRFYGAHEEGAVADILPQSNVTVYPTQTVYIFQKDGVQLKLTFSTPALMNEEEFIGLPVTFITHELTSIDRQDHKVELYYDNTAEGVVSNTDEAVTWESNENVVNDVETLEEVDIGYAHQEFDFAGNDRVNWDVTY